MSPEPLQNMQSPSFLLSLLIWLPILGGFATLAFGNARANGARWFSTGVALVTVLASVLLQGPQPESALEAAIKAVQLDQRDTFARLTLARVYWRLSRRGEALGLARSALTLARTDQQRAQAKELITFMESNAK